MTKSLVLSMLSVLPLQAAVVSWNYDNNSTVGGNGAGSLPPLTAEAGVVRVGGWSNTWPSNPTIDLRDDSGLASTIDISYTSTGGSWSLGGHPGQDADGSWNKELLNGYLNAGNAGTSSVTLTQIEYASYDIYVYFSSDNDNREGSVTDGTSTYYFNTVGTTGSIGGTNAGFVQTLDTVNDALDDEGNYAVFSGLSGASRTLTVSIPQFGGIAAIQIVQVPEPSAALLGGLGLLGLLRRRRA